MSYTIFKIVFHIFVFLVRLTYRTYILYNADAIKQSLLFIIFKFNAKTKISSTHFTYTPFAPSATTAQMYIRFLYRIQRLFVFCMLFKVKYYGLCKVSFVHRYTYIFNLQHRRWPNVIKQNTARALVTLALPVILPLILFIAW